MNVNEFLFYFYSIFFRPLRASERLYTATHRSNTQSSIKSDEATGPTDANLLKAATASSSTEKPKSRRSGEKAGIKSTTKKEKSATVENKTKMSAKIIASEEKKEKKEKKPSGGSSHSKRSKIKSNTSIDLLVSNEPVNRSGNDYNELLSPEHEVKSIVPAEKQTTSTQADDDIDFWLTTSKSQEIEAAAEAKASDILADEKKKEKKSKSSKSKDNSEGGKKSKKSLNSKKEKEANNGNSNEETIIDDHVSINEKRKEVEFDSYKPLSLNKHLKIVNFKGFFYILLNF